MNRDTRWGTVDGRSIPIRCLNDVHVANIIKHLKIHHRYNGELEDVFEKEVKIRKLSKVFLDSAPIPWQDVDGKWKRLSKDSSEYEVIGR